MDSLAPPTTLQMNWVSLTRDGSNTTPWWEEGRRGWQVEWRHRATKRNCERKKDRPIGFLKLKWVQIVTMSFRISYSIAQRLFAMRRYGRGILYAALSLHMQRGCFQIRTHDQQVTKAQLYRCTKARPLNIEILYEN